MVTLGVAGTFLGIAIVFGALAYFQTPTSGGTQKVSVPVTNKITVTPSIATSPAGATGPAPNASVVVTVTSTKVVSVPQASDGSSLAAIESGASTLAAVVAAGCAVIALRPQGRGRLPAPPAPPAPAAAADAPASSPASEPGAPL
jgi:hypothetical protein